MDTVFGVILVLIIVGGFLFGGEVVKEYEALTKRIDQQDKNYETFNQKYQTLKNKQQDLTDKLKQQDFTISTLEEEARDRTH